MSTLYEYRCHSGHNIVSFQKMGEATPTVFCPVHQDSAYRIFGPGAIYDHPLKSGYFVPYNPKTQADFVKQEAKRGHDVTGNGR